MLYFRELEIQTTTVNGLARVINGNIYRKNVDIRTKVQASWNAVNIDGNWLLLNTDVLFPAKTGIVPLSVSLSL